VVEEGKEDREVSETIRTYRDLKAWQKSMDLVRSVYETTGQMPSSERFGLTNQMRRAAVSIPSNIAEGYARQATVDYIRFLRTARGSLAELSTQTEIAISLKMLLENERLAALLQEVDRILQGLIRSLEEKLKPQKRTPGPNP
jgi:four helix bundle protein